MKKIKIFITMKNEYKILLLKTLFLSGWYRWQILHRPFEKLEKKFGKKNLETKEIEINNPYVQKVTWAIFAVCRHTPWESKCLVQAITAKTLLNKNKLPCTLYMGLCKNSKDKLEAHAWLRCGKKYVTGGRGYLKYTITATYGDIQD